MKNAMQEGQTSSDISTGQLQTNSPSHWDLYSDLHRHYLVFSPSH